MAVFDMTNAAIYRSPGDVWETVTTTIETNCPGAYVRVRFHGTDVSVGVDVSKYSGINADRYPLVGWRIDGGSWSKQLLVSAQTSLTLATGLSATDHVLEIVFAGATAASGRWLSANYRATLVLTTLTVTGGNATIALPIYSSRNWIAFGDSITEAKMVTAVSETYLSAPSDATDHWAIQLARSRGAELGNVGFTAQSWTFGGGGNVPIFHDAGVGQTWDKIREGVSRSFTGIEAILVNHGTNDESASDATVEANVTDFLNDFRAAHPTIDVHLIIPFSGTKRAAITAGFAAAGISRARLIDLGAEGEVGLNDYPGPTTYAIDGIHPNQLGHDRIFGLLDAVWGSITKRIVAVRGTP